MTAYVLMAAGIGRSMQTKGSKSILPYGSEKIIDFQIRTILDFDKSADITVVLGFKSKLVTEHLVSKKHDVRIVYNPLYDLNSQTDSLRIGINSLRKTSFYIIHGDVIFNEAALKIKRGRSGVMVDTHHKNLKGVGLSYGDTVLNLSYGLPKKWGQIAYIARDDYDEAVKVINGFKVNRCTFEYLNMLNESFGLIPYVSERAKMIEINKNYENASYKQP